jgi:hypothetical protein
MNEDPNLSDEAKRKRNRPGRSSRRRKHKARSILLEATGGETTADGATEDNKNQTSVVPSDRGYTLEGVKFRRREQWLKQGNTSNIRDDMTTCDQESQHQLNDEEGTSLDPKDEYQLKAQLGFVPGNAICVAARTSLQDFFTSPTPTDSDTNMERSETGNDPSPPAVLKLYPMAIRETYRGGTTDGRKFKARRRGAERPTKSNDAADGDKDCCDDTKKKNKKERRWFIESPSDEQTADATRLDTPEDDDESRKHIIEPFPTMYWLTSPKLRILISKMELSKDNGVQTIEQRLRSSQDYLNQMERAHKSYGRSRWELLTPKDKERVMQRGWENALDERRGVAGISLTKGRFDCVKCLHGHVAHYLAQVAECEEEEGYDGECKRDDLNLVGKWTMESIEAGLAEVGEDTL